MNTGLMLSRLKPGASFQVIENKGVSSIVWSDKIETQPTAQEIAAEWGSRTAKNGPCSHA